MTSTIFGLDRPGASRTGAVPDTASAPAPERERLLEALAHQQRVAQGGLAVAGLCHDLGSRFTALLGDIYLALQDDDPAQWRNALILAQSMATEMGDTTRAFLSFVQRTARRREAAFLVGHSVEQAVQMMKPLAKRHRVELSVSGASGEWVRGEGRLLVQILVNLISNAVQASPGNARVEVRISDPEPGVVRVEVADDGPGLPPRFRDRIYRSLASAGGSYQGLGLFAVGQLSRELGSQVQLETGSAGTTFVLDLATCEPPTLELG